MVKPIKIPARIVIATINICKNCCTPSNNSPSAIAAKPRKPMVPLTSITIAGMSKMEVGLPVLRDHRLAKTTAMIVPNRLPRLLSISEVPPNTPRKAIPDNNTDQGKSLRET